MLADRPVMSFVASATPDKAAAFYRDVLGFRLTEDTPFAVVFDLGGGRMLRIQKVPTHAPAVHTVLGWAVDDIRTEMAELSQRGVAFNLYPGMEQDEAGVWTTPDGHKVAWFSDPDGNGLSLTQFAI
jgi:catechol 2,3-dioxygenase-like lactoylglutathione lyase family enzyme